jgi:tetratricopeptide (TPR) repeat protein/predicted Ser/Thr protein kinase
MTADGGPLESGRYRIGRLLGRGGLGEVYLAHDQILARDVAIKFLNPAKFPGGDTRHAVLHEARAAAALDHPFICGIHEAAETNDGRAFIVMQYVDGQPLSERLQQGPLPVREALSLCADMADALAAAHQRGVVHRDLKPGNVIVTPAGRPKIVDFGIAKVAQTVARAGDGSRETETSGVGPLAGTPGYMSPEQLQHRGVDGRSDLFALGLVLFECLTGRRAFHGDTPVATAAEVLHVHPPPPSSLRAGLTPAHDELCRRLLAKDPADRFQSAKEVVGAIRLLVSDTSRTAWTDVAPGGDLGRRRRLKRAAWAIGALLLVAAGAGVWRWTRSPGLPAVPEQSDVWYRRGSEALREGGYYRAKKELEQAVALFSKHALAHARLAEVAAELDDPAAAKDHLLRLSELLPDESRLPGTERLRLQAVRALVLRDVDRAIELWREIVGRDPEDAGAHVDLGRAQETAGRGAEARASYAQAIALDSQNAAAFLRLASVEALASHREEALKAFAEAERLYRVRSDVEGETEVLLRRGAVMNALGDLKPARVDLERALALSTQSKTLHQQLRATLTLGSVTASEGRYEDAERMASAAVQSALGHGLDVLAAGGLIDNAATLLQLREYGHAERQTLHAIDLAQRRGATLTIARARAQLAEVYYRSDRSERALETLSGVLPFFKDNRYRRLELTSLSIAARARESLGELEEARTISTEVLTLADALQEEEQAAVAMSTLASVQTALGRYPEALRLRVRSEEVHRRNGDGASLPFDLANRADLLLRLGRPDEAQVLLAELQAGVDAGIDSYKGRLRRLTFLRAFAAATALQCDAALAPLDSVLRVTTADSPGRLAPGVRAFCDARLGRRVTAIPEPPPANADPALLRERQYWTAAAALHRNDPATAAAESARGLELLAALGNDDVRWRLTAVGAAAAHQLGNRETARTLSNASREAYDRLRTLYGQDFDRYSRRPDLTDLKRRVDRIS